MARFIEVAVESGTVRLLNTDQIAEVSQRESDGTAILHMVSGTVHPTKAPYADIKRVLAAPPK